jgi:hypothetical protein
MNIAHPNPIPNKAPRCPHCSRETEAERLARYSDGLKQLAEYGLIVAKALALKVQAQAAEATAAPEPAGAAANAPPAAPEPDPKPEPRTPRPHLIEIGRTLERVSRTVRLAYMLEDKFIQDFAARAKEAAKEAAEQQVEKERLRRNATRRTVDRVVKEAIQAEAGDQSERNHLLGQLKLRLDQNDIYWDLASKPAEILIARLFRDLGLDPNWDRWQGEAWLNGDDYKVANETPPPGCPICGRAPPPVPAAQSDRPGPEIPGTATGSDPP